MSVPDELEELCLRQDPHWSWSICRGRWTIRGVLRCPVLSGSGTGWAASLPGLTGLSMAVRKPGLVCCRQPHTCALLLRPCTRRSGTGRCSTLRCPQLRQQYRHRHLIAGRSGHGSCTARCRVIARCACVQVGWGRFISINPRPSIQEIHVLSSSSGIAFRLHILSSSVPALVLPVPALALFLFFVLSSVSVPLYYLWSACLSQFTDPLLSCRPASWLMV